MQGMGGRTDATPTSVVDPPQPIMIAAKVVAEMTNLGCQQLILSYSKIELLPHQSQRCWIRESPSEISNGSSLRGQVELLQPYLVNEVLESLDKLEGGSNLLKQLRRDCHSARGLHMQKIASHIVMNPIICDVNHTITCSLPICYPIGSHYYCR